jgi:hypothetical protein
MFNKYTVYLGLNDKITKKQEIATSAAIEKAARYLRDCTISECTGFYTHDDGEFVVEKSLKIEKIDFDGGFGIERAADDLKRMFNQESVAVEFSTVDSKLM